MPRPPRPAFRLPDPATALLLIGAVLLAYAPALSGDFVWDDDAHLTNVALQGWDGLRRIWFTLGATQQYYPVLHSAFWIEHRLWGDAVTGYHVLNVALLAIAACLVAELCTRLEIRGGWIAAFLFALHPVNVESVAWISEQKNTLSLIWYLLATMAWLRFDDSRRARDWLLAFALFALALATKTVTATLPCALLVVQWWRRGSVSWRHDVLPLLPWMVLGIASGLATAWVEQHVIGAEGSEFALSALQRVLVAGHATWHYLATFLWPARLIFTYPRWTVDPRAVVTWLYPAAMIALTAALWRHRSRSRAPLAAFLIFAGTLFPVMGFLNVYPFRYSFVADHFQYHANIALFVLVGAGIAWLARRTTTSTQQGLLALGTCVVLADLGALTYRQAGNYRDAATLYRATLVGNPDSWMAHHNLGRILSREEHGLEEAIPHFEAAIRLKPDHARAHYSLGVALQRVGRGPEAVPHLEAAMRLEPNNGVLVSNAHYILGDILRYDPSRLDEAIAHLREATRTKPMVPDGHNTLGEALLAAGRPDEARREFEEALRIMPDYAPAQRNLARLLGPPSPPGPARRR